MTESARQLTASTDGGEVILAEMAGPCTALVTRGGLRGIRQRAVHEPTCISQSATLQASAR
jgi:hypothetical protein